LFEWKRLAPIFFGLGSRHTGGYQRGLFIPPSGGLPSANIRAAGLYGFVAPVAIVMSIVIGPAVSFRAAFGFVAMILLAVGGIVGFGNRHLL
jgi:hypothetical protein